MPEGDIRPCVECGTVPFGWEHLPSDPLGFSMACGMCFTGVRTSKVASGRDKRGALDEWNRINVYRWPPKEEQ